MKLLAILRKEENYLWEGLAASVAFHLLLFHAGDLGVRFPVKRTVEIDITSMGRAAAVAPPKRAAAPAAPSPKPAAPPKEWLKAAPDQKVAPAAAPTAPVAPAPPEPPPQAAPGAGQAQNGEIGVGTGEGGEVRLARLPQLLNLADLAAIQKRFYPEKAREDGREATVVLDVHIGANGRVTAVEVVQSADPDFDAAAVHVAKLLRFSPAYVAREAVAVKMRQAIQFKLAR